MLACPSCATENPDDSRFCRNCAAPLSSAPSDAAATVAIPAPSPSRGGTAVRMATSSSVDEGRFPPGTLLAERYRIIALLGKGGMGEVYRANDLRLGQPVALKFLPEAAAHDARTLARFHEEVRIARQISHPNVCRVYDIGEVDGVPFLSMEYIDGEDLASLLRRIGRLPVDKALDIARRLCAGLAAAHEKGVLHRDLKPANIMVDGRGQVRIMDFGLAAVATELDPGEVRHGTPAYMAPEQLAGREVTVRSDVYALGLVLYEIFTGKRAFEAGSLAELVRMQEESAPVSLSSLVRDMDPAVERAILRCLAPDPRNRPASALAVAAALPGGDPLAAALAAGETPSPEMVAASGETEGLRTWVAASLLGGILAGLVALTIMSGHRQLTHFTPFDNPPEALAALARQTVQRLGYVARPAGTAYDFDYAPGYLDWLKKNRSPEARRALLASAQPAPLRFWYRQSLGLLNPYPSLHVTYDDPPLETVGMVRIKVDMQGRLYSFDAVPDQVVKSIGPVKPPDWALLFTAAGLDIANFEPAAPQWTPLVACDTRAAWTGSVPGAPDIPLRVEAAAFRGAPVYFQLAHPWSGPTRNPDTSGAATGQIIYLLVMGAILVSACVLAWRNVRLNRGDRRGATRLAGFLLVAIILRIAAGMSHVPDPGELNLLTQAFQDAMLTAATMWLMYLALEPYVRSRWPQTLVSWSRVLAGRMRDPRVAADCLIGIAVGLFWELLFAITDLLHLQWGGMPERTSVYNLLGVLRLMNHLLMHLTSGFVFALQCFFLVFLLRVVLRKSWLAAAVFVLMFVALRAGETTFPWLDIPVLALTYGVLLAVLLRFGLVPLVIAVMVADQLGSTVLTLDGSVWYFGTSLTVLLLITAGAVWSFHTAIAGRPLFKDELLSR